MKHLLEAIVVFLTIIQCWDNIHMALSFQSYLQDRSALGDFYHGFGVAYLSDRFTCKMKGL